jgi:hypothetical protein
MPPEENKTQDTPEPETQTENQPVETASPEIEKEQKIRQIGTTGRFVYYVLKQG